MDAAVDGIVSNFCGLAAIPPVVWVVKSVGEDKLVAADAPPPELLEPPPAKKASKTLNPPLAAPVSNF